MICRAARRALEDPATHKKNPRKPTPKHTHTNPKRTPQRRILRKIAAREEHELGDVSTLADPGVVQQLLDLRGK